MSAKGSAKTVWLNFISDRYRPTAEVGAGGGVSAVFIWGGMADCQLRIFQLQTLLLPHVRFEADGDAVLLGVAINQQVFGLLGEKAEAKKCPAMAGIVEEGEEIIDETDEGSAQRDVGIIFAAQKAEHYEIATYGGLAQLAKTLGYQEAKDLLGKTLEEEKQADSLLTEIAEGGINYQAGQED